MKILVVIPARGGSKGIPRKNLRLLSGKPLIQYAIDTALKSTYEPMVLVSSDDEEILTVASKCGASTLKRVTSLSNDQITLDPVVLDAFIQNGSKADIIITVQPTSPLLSVSSLDAVIERLLSDSTLDTLVSVVDDTHLTWSASDGTYFPNYKERLNRQYLPKVFKETGAVVACKAKVLLNGSRFGNKISVYEIPKREAVDIDSLEDWALCEYYLAQKQIVFSVAGYSEIGMGHVYNCLTIAGGLTKYKVAFVVDSKSILAFEKLRAMNYPVYIAGEEEDIADLIFSLKPDVVINDRLDTDKNYMDRLKSREITVVNIEDIGPGAMLADLVINAIYPEKIPLPKHYFGSSYFCLRDEFLLTEPRSISEKVTTILVAFGGTDPNNFTERILKLISGRCANLGITIDVIVGMGYTQFDSISDYSTITSIRIHRDVQNISDFMNAADIVFTSAGRTTYEVASLGRPTIVLAQNKRETSHFFASAEQGFINLGLGNKVSDAEILKQFDRCVDSYELRLQMHESMLKQNLKSGRKNLLKLIEEVI